LGRLYSGTGAILKAEQLLRRALTIRERLLGPDHSAVAASVNALAVVLSVEKRYAESGPLFLQALAIQERRIGSTHPSVATTQENYAALLRGAGRLEDAALAGARARRIRDQAPLQQAPSP
jgi:tetratricopeptide (TPR) repeat protein